MSCNEDDSEEHNRQEKISEISNEVDELRLNINNLRETLERCFLELNDQETNETSTANRTNETSTANSTNESDSETQPETGFSNFIFDRARARQESNVLSRRYQARMTDSDFLSDIQHIPSEPEFRSHRYLSRTIDELRHSLHTVYENKIDDTEIDTYSVRENYRCSTCGSLFFTYFHLHQHLRNNLTHRANNVGSELNYLLHDTDTDTLNADNFRNKFEDFAELPYDDYSYPPLLRIDSTSNLFDNVTNDIDIQSDELTDEYKNEVNADIVSNEFVCDECGEIARNIIELLDHKMIMHENPIEYDQYICDACDKTFSNDVDLDNHYEQEHRNIFSCVYCENTYGDENDLEHHVNEMHADDANNIREEIEVEDVDDNYDIDIQINYELMDNGQFKCKHCGEEFESDDIDDHIETVHKDIVINTNEADSDDEIKEDNVRIYRRSSRVSEINRTRSRYSRDYGNVICPVCSQRFTSQFYLGEHFTEDHQSYESQINLDNLGPKNSFPGFETLENINMIYVFRQQKKEMQSELKGLKCEICNNDFSIDKKIKNGCDIDNLDDCVLLNEEKPVDNKNNENNQSDDDIIIESLHYPTIMMCCGNKVCHECVKTNCEMTNTIMCMFCKYDHSLRSDKFIEIYEPDFGYGNELSWKEWWKKSDRTNLLAFNKS